MYDSKAVDLWTRFYDPETELPFICYRDGVKNDHPGEIGYKRRNC